MSLISNAQFAQLFLGEAYPTDAELPPTWAQVLNVAGEAGEFAEAYRRYSGHARRSSGIDEVMSELADVVISAYVAAERLNESLDRAIEIKRAVILTRGFKE